MSGVEQSVTLSSIDQLSLEGLFLDKTALAALPKNVYQDLFAEFSKVLRDPRAPLPSKWDKQVSSLSVEDGKIYFRPKNGVQDLTKSLPVSDFPGLQKAILKTRDVARRQMPEVFSDKKSFAYSLPKAPPPPPERFFGAEKTSLVIDVNSVLRNSLTAAGKAKSFIPVSAAIGGALSMYVALDCTQRGFSKAVEAAQCGDTQGVADGVLFTGVGLSYLGLGTGMALSSDTVAAPLQFSSSTVHAIGSATNYFAIGMFGLILADSVVAGRHVYTFRKDLNTILDRKEVSAQEKATEGLLFLQQQISLTESDMGDLKGKPIGEYNRRLQEKWGRFVRRVGVDCAEKVARRSKALLEKAKKGDTQAIFEAIKLLEMADRASHQQWISQVLLFGISILGLVGAFFSVFAEGTPIAPILYAVTTAIFLLVDSSDLSSFANSVIFKGDTEAARANRWKWKYLPQAHVLAALDKPAL